MSEADMMKARDKVLASDAAGFNVSDPPDVALIRWTTKLDWGSTMAQCLQDAGFNIVGAGFGISAPDGIGPSQLSAYDLAFYTCDAQYTVNPQYQRPLNAAQWGLTYDYDVEWMVPCVAAFGVTASQPPTRETFVAQGLQQGYVTWEPWSEGQAVYSNKPWAQQKAFMDTCPADPPSQYLWGM